MRVLYTCAYVIGVICYAPVFFFRKKGWGRVRERMGFFREDLFASLKGARPVWIHAVSVGETKAAVPLVRELKTRYPDTPLVISNVTHTGHEVAKKALPEAAAVFYIPFDIPFCVRRVIAAIDPVLFVSIETELWPNLITELHRRHIPVAIVNGRLSEGSFRGYKAVGFYMRTLLGMVNRFCMRTGADADRIRRLGAEDAKVEVTGDLKFNIASDDKGGVPWPVSAHKDRWLGSDTIVFIAGSTHQGEEEALIESFARCRARYPSLVLIIAPRHVARTKEIVDKVCARGLGVTRISEVESMFRGPDRKENPEARGPVFLLDSIGHLSELYRIGDIVFLGGSLVPHGGHNFIEPAVWGKALLTGPHIHNFTSMAELFLARGALTVVHDREALTAACMALLGDPQKREHMGLAARDVVSRNQDAAARTGAVLSRLLGDSE